MKQVAGFLRATVLGGFFVLLPFLVIGKLVAEAVRLARTAAHPLAARLPDPFARYDGIVALLAVVLLVSACFLCGLLMRAAVARSAGAWVERNLLFRLPGYRAVKSLTQGLGGSTGAGAFKPALVSLPEGHQALAYLIEDHGDGRATVLLPSSPNPMAGSVRIVARNRVQLLDGRLTDLTAVLSRWGVGTQALLGKAKPS